MNRPQEPNKKIHTLFLRSSQLHFNSRTRGLTLHHRIPGLDLTKMTKRIEAYSVINETSPEVLVLPSGASCTRGYFGGQYGACKSDQNKNPIKISESDELNEIIETGKYRENLPFLIKNITKKEVKRVNVTTPKQYLKSIDLFLPQYKHHTNKQCPIKMVVLGTPLPWMGRGHSGVQNWQRVILDRTDPRDQK